MTAPDFAALRADLRADEGERLRLYRCPAGKLTIGVGHNIEDLGISERVSSMLLQEDIDECYSDLIGFPWFTALDTTRQRALLNLRFQLGPSRFREFKRMIAALDRKDFETAANELEDSRWWTQTQKQRRERVQRMVRTGRA